MSAWMVSTGCMDRCVAAILKICQQNEITTVFGVNIEAEDAGDVIGRKLYAVNAEAVRQAYPKSSIMVRPPRDYVHSPAVAEGCSQAGLYKALECLTFCCTEGTVADSSHYLELLCFKRMYEPRVSLASPEYAQAMWD